MRLEEIGKVLFVVPSFSNGGAERVVTVLASALAEKGIDTHCIVYYKAEKEYTYSEKVKVTYLAGKGEHSYSSLGMGTKVKLLSKLIEEIKPCYIIPFLPQVGFHVFLATLGRHYKIIQTVRNNPRIDPPSKAERIIRDALVALSWKSFVQNEDQFNYFNRYIKKKLTVIPNPILKNFFEVKHVYSAELRKIVGMGRLSEQKNFPLLIKAAKILHEKYSNIQFLIYGDGPLKAELQSMIDEYGLNEIVVLKGRTDNSIEALNSADIFVLSSNYEGMPNALLEAMAIGLPCISTNCPTGPSDIIIPGENGKLIEVNQVD